jgi:hypothetical protein
MIRVTRRTRKSKWDKGTDGRGMSVGRRAGDIGLLRVKATSCSPLSSNKMKVHS